MNCGALLYYEIRGKVRPKRKLVQMISRANQTEYPHMIDRPISYYDECDGEIGVEVTLDSDYATEDNCECYVSVSYFCKKCGNVHFPELSANTDGVEKLAEAAIRMMI